MIRRCNTNDVEALVKLEQECFNSPLSYSFLLQDIKDNPLSYYLCYEENGVVIAYIGLWLTEEGSILNLCVSNLYRCKGIASLLIEEAIKVFNDKNISEISLEVRVSNDKALSLYKKYKFKELLIRKNYYENNEDAIVMVRSSI